MLQTWGRLAVGVIVSTGATIAVCSAAPADATRPANVSAEARGADDDRVTRLEQQLAELQRRLERLETQRSAPQPAVFYAPIPGPAMVPGLSGSPQLPGSAQAVPVPTPGDGEINGVKFRVFLLNDEKAVRR